MAFLNCRIGKNKPLTASPHSYLIMNESHILRTGTGKKRMYMAMRRWSGVARGVKGNGETRSPNEVYQAHFVVLLG